MNLIWLMILMYGDYSNLEDDEAVRNRAGPIVDSTKKEDDKGKPSESGISVNSTKEEDEEEPKSISNGCFLFISHIRGKYMNIIEFRLLLLF